MSPLAIALTALVYACFINLLTFFTFGIDKAAARDGARRVPERLLLNLSAAGGSPAALYACHHFRHKTRKQPFRGMLLTIVAIQVVVAVAVFVGWH